MSLYNEERPHDFSSIVGQEKVVKVLINDLKRGKKSGAYLFSGVRGTGKTTLARIIAEAVNCEHPAEDGSPCGKCAACTAIREKTCVDVYELDAASNNSVEKIRDMLSTVQYRPVYNTKVYILDECHMLSNSASNALLKALEEPAENTVFILCTTERHKILPTIISRCSCYEFEKISIEQISSHLANVCQKHGAVIEKKALDIIAKAADGSMRDALSILDKFIFMENVDATVVAEALGMAADDIVISILNGIVENAPALASDALKKFSNRGGSLSRLIEKMFEFLLDMVDFQQTGSTDSIVGTDEYRNSIVELSYKIDTQRAFHIMDAFRKIYQNSSDFAFLAAILGVIEHQSLISELKQEVARLSQEVETLKQAGIVASGGTKDFIIDNSPVGSSVMNEVESSAVVDSSNMSTAPSPVPAGNACYGDAAYDDSLCAQDGSFDSSFPYEEDVPDFGEASREEMVPRESSSTPSAVTEPANADTFVGAIPTGLSFEELVALEESGGLDSALETSSSNAVVQQPNEHEAEESFFGDMFRGSPRLF